MSKVKIMLLVTQMELGGAQKAMLAVAAGLDPQLYEVTPSVLYTKNELNPVAKNLGAELQDFRFKKSGDGLFKQILTSSLGCFRLYRFLRRHRFHILQTYCFYANLIGVVIGRLAGVPIIVTSQRNSYHSMGRLALLIDRLVASLAGKTVAVCESTRQFSIHHEGFQPSRIATVRNGIEKVDATALKPFDRRMDRLIFLTAARLFRKKGIHILLEAVAQLSPNLSWNLWLLGDGPEREALERQAAVLGIKERVTFFGWRADILPYMAACDIFVLPSLEEGFPNVLLEAMALRKPIIATDVDGNGEAVLDGSTGILTPPGDVRSLREALVRLGLDESLRIRMGQSGFQRVSTEFTIEKMIDGFHQIYQELLKPLRRRPKLLLVCSSGGHLLQLHLLKDWWSAYRRVWCTFKKVDAVSMLAGEQVYWAYYPTNRNFQNLVLNFYLALTCLMKEKPALVVSTGAGVAAPFLLIARCMGIRTLFIEEYNRVQTPTLTGRLVYHFVDVFMIQWPELRKFYPRAVYRGSIL